MSNYYVQSNYTITLQPTNYTLSAGDSGKIFLLPDLGADQTITLPAPGAGLHFVFINLSLAAVHNWILTCGTQAQTLGLLIRLAAAPLVATASGATGHINFIGTSIAGDCTGTAWSIRATRSAAGGITAT